MITILTGSYLRRKLRLSVCKDLGSSPSITISSKILTESNTHPYRVKGTRYVQVTLPQSAWPRLGKALGKPGTHVSQIFLLGERTSGSLRTPQEPCQLPQKVTSLPGLGGTAWVSGHAPGDEHLGQRLSSVMMWLVSM